MVASDSFAEFLREQLAPLGRTTVRRMFGKTGVFCDGLMFAMVTDDTLYFRVDDHNRAAFKEAESYPPLNYGKKGRTIDLAFCRAPGRGEARTKRATAKIRASSNVRMESIPAPTRGRSSPRPADGSLLAAVAAASAEELIAAIGLEPRHARSRLH